MHRYSPVHKAKGGSLDHPFLTEIRVFLGGHRIASSHMRDVILANIDLLNAQSIHVVDPVDAKKALVHAFGEAKALEKPEVIARNFIEKVLPDWEPSTLVVGHEGLAQGLIRPANGKWLYPGARPLVDQMTRIFSELPLTYSFGIRSPRTYFPSVYAEGVAHANMKPFGEFLEGLKLSEMRWSDTIKTMADRAEDQSVLTWRYEDYPYIWREVVAAITGLDNPQDLVPTKTPITRGISLEGATQLLAKANDNPDKRAFADMVTEIRKDFPADAIPSPHSAWSEALQSDLEARYRADWAFIQTLPGVTAITRRDYR